MMNSPLTSLRSVLWLRSQPFLSAGWRWGCGGGWEFTWVSQAEKVQLSNWGKYFTVRRVFLFVPPLGNEGDLTDDVWLFPFLASVAQCVAVETQLACFSFTVCALKVKESQRCSLPIIHCSFLCVCEEWKNLTINRHQQGVFFSPPSFRSWASPSCSHLCF